MPSGYASDDTVVAVVDGTAAHDGVTAADGVTAQVDGVTAQADGTADDGITAGERALLAAFTELTHALLIDLDEVDLLQLLVGHAVRTSAARSAGVMITDRDGRPSVVAASSSDQRAIETLQLQAHDGPCLDCIRTGAPVSVTDLTHEDRWPAWTPAALRNGVRSGRAVPLTAAGTTFGALNLFSDRPGAFGERSGEVGAALAGVAAVSLAAVRRAGRATELAEQLQHALGSRVVVEQAKGVVATMLGTTMDEAFELLRRYSRSHNRRLREVAELVANGQMDARDTLPPS